MTITRTPSRETALTSSGALFLYVPGVHFNDAVSPQPRREIPSAFSSVQRTLYPSTASEASAGQPRSELPPTSRTADDVSAAASPERRVTHVRGGTHHDDYRDNYSTCGNSSIRPYATVTSGGIKNQSSLIQPASRRVPDSRATSVAQGMTPLTRALGNTSRMAIPRFGNYKQAPVASSSAYCPRIPVPYANTSLRTGPARDNDFTYQSAQSSQPRQRHTSVSSQVSWRGATLVWEVSGGRCEWQLKDLSALQLWPFLDSLLSYESLQDLELGLGRLGIRAPIEARIRALGAIRAGLKTLAYSQKYTSAVCDEEADGDDTLILPRELAPKFLPGFKRL